MTCCTRVLIRESNYWIFSHIQKMNWNMDDIAKRLSGLSKASDEYWATNHIIRAWLSTLRTVWWIANCENSIVLLDMKLYLKQTIWQPRLESSVTQKMNWKHSDAQRWYRYRKWQFAANQIKTAQTGELCCT